jgi:TetR/AcrR family transcriptional regulator
VIFTEALKRLVPKVIAILESDLPLFDKIKMFCEDYIDTVIQNPYIPLFVINEMNKQSDEFVSKIWGREKPGVKKFFQQVEEEVNKGVIKPIEPYQLLTHVISMTIFPFVARPILLYMTDMNTSEYEEFIKSRKTEIPRFVIDAIKK